jgi:hypothetical protein
MNVRREDTSGRFGGATITIAIAIAIAAAVVGSSSSSLAHESVAYASESAIVTLSDRVTVANPRVLLGAIARIDASDPSVAESLDSVLVGLAPLPGRRRIVERGEVEQALALAGYAPWDVRIQGAERIEIERSVQRISEAQLARAIRQRLATELGLPESEIGFRRLEFGRVDEVGGGALDLRPVFESEPRLNAPLRASVHIVVADVPAARVDGVVEVVRRTEQAFREEQQPAPRTASARGSRSKQRLVRSGQPVTLELRGPGLLITAQGKARRTGGLGDEIPVENVISGVVVRGTILGAGRVQVHWSPVTGLPDVREEP